MVFLYLFVFSLIFCFENSENNYNLINYNDICPNEDDECSFHVSYNYPISPKIPNNFPGHAKLSDYRYVYLIFSIPKTQNQKSFYLEAYDTSNKETIISNGDCYYIDTAENNEYEIRIYKELKTDSYIRFEFLGISQDFTMIVKLRFTLSIILYIKDIALTDENSYYKTYIDSLKDYLIEKDKKIIQQKNREKLSKATCSKIMESIFNTFLDQTLFEDPYYSSIIIPSSPFFLVTVEYTVGLDLTFENIFKPERNVLSETTVIDGKIDSHYDRFYFLNEKINKNNNVIKIIELYNKRVIEFVLELMKETKYFTLTISTDSNNNIAIFTLKYYNEKTKKIYYEIQIKIQFNNLNIKKLAKKASVPIISFSSEINEEMIKNMFDRILFILGVFDTLKSINPVLDNEIKSLPLFDNNKINTISIALSSILHGFDDHFSNLGIDTAEFGAIFLDMKLDNNTGIYYADFDCWQQKFGYNIIYDIVFDLFTSMDKNNNGIFSFNNQNYIFWAWKGDYINLGAGAELGIYYGGSSKDFSHWKVNKSLAMQMTLKLTHKTIGTIINNWDNNGENTWWITAFNPKYKKLKAKDLIASFTVKFPNEVMFKEFSKTKKEGWNYNKADMIATLTF